MTNIQDRCSSCGMTRDERFSYQGGCPMQFPEMGCPLADVDSVAARIARIKAAIKDGSLKPISDANPFTVHLTWGELRQKLIEMGWTPPGPPAEGTCKLNNDHTVAVSNDVFWNPDMDACPRGVKVQLLGAGGVALYGVYDGKDPFFTDWAPVPRRRSK